jgi:uncharacterized protein YutD
MSKKTNEELSEMRRPVINKVDRVSEEEILINDHAYRLEKDYREAFDPELLAERFVGLFSRYDFLVGDIGSGQLRLKGFYADDAQVPSEIKISRVQDYLYEYCSFGCPYFILRNMQVNERAKKRWMNEQKRSEPKKPGKPRPKKTKKTNKPVAKRRNEVVGVGKKKKQKTFTIREKK